MTNIKVVGTFVIGAILALTSLYITNRIIHAQQTNTITLNVSPTVVELDTNPGETQKGSFKIVNGSDIELELETTPKNFTASDEVGGVNLTEEDTNYSLAKWIKVSPENAKVPARGSQIFNYIIEVPDRAEPGGHFGSIIVQTQAVNIDQTGPAVSQEVGPLILVRVAGDTYQEASIVEFKTKDSVLEKPPVAFETRIKNTGNVHFKPKGTIEIKDMFGKVVTTLDLEEKNVLPDSIRKLSNDWNPTGFQIGRFTANLTVVYGVDDKIVTSSSSFILFPYKTIIPLTIGIIIFIFLVIKNRIRIKKAISVLKNG